VQTDRPQRHWPKCLCHPAQDQKKEDVFIIWKGRFTRDSEGLRPRLIVSINDSLLRMPMADFLCQSEEKACPYCLIPGAGEGFRGDDRAVLSSGAAEGHNRPGPLFEKGGGRAALRRGRRRLRGLKRRVCGALRDFRQEWSLGRRRARLRPGRLTECERRIAVGRRRAPRWHPTRSRVASRLRRAKSSRALRKAPVGGRSGCGGPAGTCGGASHRSAPARPDRSRAGWLAGAELGRTGTDDAP